MRLSSSSKVAPVKVSVANRSPSPDVSVRRYLPETKQIDFDLVHKTSQQHKFKPKFSHNPPSNQNIKSRILTLNSQNASEQSHRASLTHKSKKKLNMTTLEDQRLSTKQSINKQIQEEDLRNSRVVKGQEKTLIELKQKLESMRIQNDYLRKILFQKKGTQSSDTQKIKQELEKSMHEQISRFQQIFNKRIKELAQNTNKTELMEIRESKTQRDSEYSATRSLKHSQELSIVEEEHANYKKINTSYLTPLQKYSIHDEINPLQYNPESEKLIQLQKQNEDLTKENFQYKKAYDQLIRRQQQSNSHAHVSEFNVMTSSRKPGDRLIKSTTQVEELLRQNNQLKIKNMGLEKSFIEIKRGLDKNIRVTQSINQLSPNDKELKKVLTHKNQEIFKLCKIIQTQKQELVKAKNEQSKGKISMLTEENNRLREELIHIRNSGDLSSRSQTSADHDRKRIKDLESRTNDLQMELLKVRGESQDDLDKIVAIKQAQIHKLKLLVNSMREDEHQKNHEITQKLNYSRFVLQQANSKINEIISYQQHNSFTQDSNNFFSQDDNSGIKKLEKDLRQERGEKKLKQLKLVQEKIRQAISITEKIGNSQNRASRYSEI